MSEAKMQDIKQEIAAELCAALAKLAAESELLRIVGSYGETMADYWVLGMLRQWNNRGSR